jgi:pyridoxal/pyridoxine/pyridoxamine kinase
MVVATSIPVPENRLATLLHDATGTVFTSVPRRPKAPSGTGDLLTGLFTGARCASMDSKTALAVAGTRLENVLRATEAADDLNLGPLYKPDENLQLLMVEAAT